MKPIYPGLNTSLDTKNSRFKGMPLYAIAGQSYFNTLEQDQMIDPDFIEKQNKLTEKNWDARVQFSFQEYSALSPADRLQLTRLHAIRWNYTLLLYEHSISIAMARDDYPDPRGNDQWQEKEFLQSLNEHKEIRKLYAGWFLNQVENACGAITPKVESLFKREMELAASDDLSKDKAIAKKVDQFRDHITQLEALAVNQTDAIKVALNNYSLVAVKFFILSQLNQIDSPSFKEELEQKKNECDKVLKDPQSRVTLLTIALNNPEINITEHLETIKHAPYLAKALLILHDADISVKETWEQVKDNTHLQKALTAAYDYTNSGHFGWNKTHGNHGKNQTKQFIKNLMASADKNLGNIRAEMKQWVQGYGFFGQSSNLNNSSRLSFVSQSGLFGESATLFSYMNEGQRKEARRIILSYPNFN
ncbi:hypothetical protein [Piscirickettsia salmonis]|uniref:hypothetical protein n=1 Tax=Piscirickettsia salmonis TaxID=1238 RepID=UPI003A80D7B1